jgi:hypothetical protein
MDRLTHKKSSYAAHTVDVETYTEGRKLVYKSDNDPKFLYNLAAHDRRAHKRRRPRTSITAPQDVKVRATVVGTPKKGAIARVFRAIEPEP